MHINPIRATMRNRRRQTALAVSVLALLLGGCVSQRALERPQSDVRIDADAQPSPASSRRAAYEYHVLAGEMAIQRDNRRLAAREYVAALGYSSDPKLARRATRIALYADKPELAYQAAGIWARAAPDELDAQRTATRLALVNDDAHGLGRHAKAMVAAAASPDTGYRLLTNVLSGQPESADMVVDALAGVVEQDADSAPAQYALGVVALRYERNDVAARAAERALALAPDWSDAVLLQAGVWIREGETEAAQRLVDQLPGNAASRAGYHLALARLLIESDEQSAALLEFERAVQLQPDNADARYGLAILALNLGELDRAETAFTHLYEQSDRPDDAAFYLGVVAEQRQAYADAQRWYQRVDNGSHAFESQVRAARMIYLQDDLPGAQRRLAQLRDTYPELADQLYAAEGQLLFEAQQMRAALAVYNQGLEAVPESSELRYGRSLVHERLGDIQAAQADLRVVLEREPNDARALNALGYLLTNHSDHYDEAFDYIQRALEIEPDSPAIVDSMGWVEYRLGHLIKARRYLERAYSDFRDGEVAAHLGEVLWKQGQHEAAREIWQGALADDPDNPVLLETVNRLDP